MSETVMVESPFRGRTGTVASYVPGSGHWVNFDDGRVENVLVHWLDAA